jgi:inositol phosphorylceramide mannosyltransferase catalytic subunit
VPAKYDRWRSSWLKYNPDFKYTLWDEHAILKLGMKNEFAFKKTKNLGAKSDLARYEILNRFGGIYVDTDFECLQPLKENLLTLDFFCGQVFSNEPELANGIMGSVPSSIFTTLIIDSLREPLHSDDPMTILKGVGSQKITEIYFNNIELMVNSVVFPSDFFYPWPNFSRLDHLNRYRYSTPVSQAVHHWEVSWARESFIMNMLRKIKSRTKEELFRWKL